MKAGLEWVAAIPLLVMLMSGVGLVMAYVLAGTTFGWMVAGVALLVLCWHGLRWIEPRAADERPEEGWEIFGLIALTIWWKRGPGR